MRSLLIVQKLMLQKEEKVRRSEKRISEYRTPENGRINEEIAGLPFAGQVQKLMRYLQLSAQELDNFSKELTALITPTEQNGKN